MADIKAIITDAANRYGVDPETAIRMARIENGYSGDFDWRIINNPEGFLDIVRRDKHVFRFNTDGNLWTAHLGWVSDRFADRGARVWHDGGIWEFGAIDPNYNALTADAPAPYVLIGLRSSRGTNTINLRAIQLRNN